MFFLRLAIQLCAWHHCVHFYNWTTLSRRWLLWLRATTGITFLLFVNRRCDDTEEIERNSRKHNIDSNSATEIKLRTEFAIEGASNRFVCSRNMAMYNVHVQCTDHPWNIVIDTEWVYRVVNTKRANSSSPSEFAQSHGPRTNQSLLPRPRSSVIGLGVWVSVNSTKVISHGITQKRKQLYMTIHVIHE